jgi:hypothetical protein
MSRAIARHASSNHLATVSVRDGRQTLATVLREARLATTRSKPASAEALRRAANGPK